MSEPQKAGQPDPQALLTMLTTEHFTLQGARGNTVSESASRAALYVGALSASLVAVGLIGQASQVGHAFDVFVLVVLPTLYAVGTFTFVRLVESSVEDLYYGRAINRIRNYYRDLAGDQARYFVLGGHDDVSGVLANMGLPRPSRWQLFFTLATMIAVVNGAVGGSAIAFATDLMGLPLAAACCVGAAVGIATLVVSHRWQYRFHDRASQQSDVLFPSSDAPAAQPAPGDAATT